ncbi:hypothetical protein [Woodsholea maritima]|uniref:hypothetical protein n=1 Tax=Woodsholea maritima TaxID=240237 RepID=UPI00035FB654|nr:hypothetical protein [Woodsholea maritima]
MQRNRCIELGLASIVALSGLVLGFSEVSDAESHASQSLTHLIRSDWDANSAIRAPLYQEARQRLSPEAARSAQAILAVRQASTQTSARYHYDARHFEAPGPGYLEVRQDISTGQNPLDTRAFASLASVQIDYVLPLINTSLDEFTDLSFDARSGIGFSADVSEVTTSGQLELITRLDKEKSFPHWSLFVGGERQALFLNEGADFSLTNGLSYEHFATVGRTQAGAAWRFSDSSSLSLSYMYEETAFALSPQQNWEEDEHSVGLVYERRW